MPETMTIASHGVEFEFDMSALADPRFTYCLSRVADETVGDTQRFVFYGRMLSVLLGEDGAYALMCRLADANEGRVDNDLFNEFFGDLLEQARAKNS